MAQHHTGDIINQHYEILGVLGKGGMGTTYAALHLETVVNVAIKAISLRGLKEIKQLELLEREIEVLKRLNHPGIPKYLDYFEIDSDSDRIFYIVQQLASGKNLAQWVEEGWRVTEAEVKHIATQILHILAYLHHSEPPIIHRDIKPHNIIRSQEGELCLVDFGSVQNTYYSTFMGGSTTVGTFGYMPLEQASGKACPASDLYSLGATLIYLLTHRNPSELSEDGLTINFRSRITLSEEFAEWLEKILEPDLEARFTSVKEAFTALKDPKIVREERLSKIRWLAWLGLGVGSVAGLMGFYTHKWEVLHKLGYPTPVEVCQDQKMTVEYLNTGENLTQAEANKCILWAASQDKDIVELLIAKGADVNVKDEYGNTLLHKAVEKGHKDIVELLIAKGADVNVKDNDGNTLLHKAVEKGDKDIVELLIAKGADVNVKDEYGNTLLHKAVEKGDKDIVELLIAKGADVNVKDKDGFTLLHWAAENGHKDIVELLIAKGVDVNIKDQDGFTLLHWAAENGHKDIVELLIAKGADVNVNDKYGYTPLHEAAWKGNKDVVELLIAKGADVNVKGNDGYTPLHGAAESGHQYVVQLLIAKGADVNVKGNDGYTPLHKAAWKGNKDVVELLIAKGADVNAKDKHGYTPLDLAVERGNEDIVAILKAHGARE